MTFCEAMDTRRFDLVVGFCFQLAADGMDGMEIKWVLDSPWKWEAEFAEFLEKWADVNEVAENWRRGI